MSTPPHCSRTLEGRSPRCNVFQQQARFDDFVEEYNRERPACIGGRKINLSHFFAGRMVGIKQVEDRIRLVSFMHYDLGYFEDETCRLEPIDNPFGPTVLPMSPE